MNTDRSSFVPLIPVPENFQRSARISTQADYERMHTESIQRPDAFWRRELDSLDIRGT